MMTPIEIIALVLIILGAVKMLVIAVNPKSWASVVKKIYSGGKWTTFIFFVLALVSFYYLLQVLTIIQILAVTLFIAFLMGLSFSGYPKEMIGLADKMLKRGNIWRKNWLVILVWIILLVWGLIALFS